MDEGTKFVVDASFVLAFLLPDEESPEVEALFDKHTLGQASLVAPTILPFEVFNSLKMALKRHRLNKKNVSEIAEGFLDLKIEISFTDYEKTFSLAIEYDLSFYDASYVFLAKSLQLPLLTLDKQLKKLI